jgi:Tol biopolymer transport system component
MKKKRTAWSHSFITLAILVSASPLAHATYPGRNGMIAFQADTGSGSQIYTVRSNGRDLRQLTHLTGSAERPDWSPDSRRIIFEHDTEDSANVAIINADGGDLMEFPSAPNGFEGAPTFTPDGRQIVFLRFDFVELDNAIWSMNLDGSERRRIIGPWPGVISASIDFASVSPGGKTLAFVGFDGVLFGPAPSFEPARALFTCDIDGGNLFQITPFTADMAIKVDWAPDGRRLLITDNANFFHRGESANIATIRPDGTDLHYLTHYQGGEVNAFFGSSSPDGRWIVFRLEDHGSYALYRMHCDGSHLRAVLGFSNFRPRFIDWGSRSDGRGDDEEDE